MNNITVIWLFILQKAITINSDQFHLCMENICIEFATVFELLIMLK